jgi:nitrous-oxide reductase transcriptional activator nosR
MYHHDTRCPQVVATNKKKQKQAAAKAEPETASATQQPTEQVVQFVKK